MLLLDCCQSDFSNQSSVMLKTPATTLELILNWHESRPLRHESKSVECNSAWKGKNKLINFFPFTSNGRLPFTSSSEEGTGKKEKGLKRKYNFINNSFVINWGTKTGRRAILVPLKIIKFNSNTISVARAEHLRVNDNINSIGAVPSLAQSVLDDWHVDCLKRFGPQSRSRVQGAPARGPSEFPEKILIFLRQTNRR